MAGNSLLGDGQIDHRSGLRDVVMRTLAKDPDNRYQDLAEVADALENIVADLRTDERKRMEQFRMRLGKLIGESRTLAARTVMPAAATRAASRYRRAARTPA